MPTKQKHYNIPIFVPHAGCTNACIFCNQRAITGEDRAPSIAEVRELIERYLGTIPPVSAVEIAFFGGSFTGIEEGRQRAYLALAKEYVDAGRVCGIRLSTRPDLIDVEVIGRLQEYGVTAVELGAQSLDDEVLRRCARGHTKEAVASAVARLKEAGFEVGIQLMLGLPGDDRKTFAATLQKAAALCPDTVRLYPTLVLQGTELYRLWQRGEYRPLDLSEAIRELAAAVRLFCREKIRIIRIGLYPDESPGADRAYVAGPWHPALGELAQSAALYEEMCAQLRGVAGQGKRLQIFTAPRMVSRIVGQKRKNIARLKSKFAFSEVSVTPDEAMEPCTLLDSFRIRCQSR